MAVWKLLPAKWGRNSSSTDILNDRFDRDRLAVTDDQGQVPKAQPPTEDYNLPVIEDGGSSDNMGVDGSITPVEFVTADVPVNKVLRVKRLTFYMEEATGNFNSALFLSQAALTVGVTIAIGGVVIATWKNNRDIILSVGDLGEMANMTMGQVRNNFKGVWVLPESFGLPSEVLEGQNVTVTINDDLSDVSYFQMTVQGRLTDV